MSRQKYCAWILAFSLIFFYTGGDSEKVAVAVSAKSYAVIEQETGRILGQSNANVKMPMASITKVMTAILAIEHGNLSDVVTVSENASGVEGSSVYLAVGEKLSLEDLLYCLMLASGNDASIAIAEHVGKTVDEFVNLMNEKAKELGAENTHFANPNGLPHDLHHTTALDFARISAYAMGNDEFVKIVSTRNKTVPNQNQQWDRALVNKNRLLLEFPGCDGVKTGYTKKAGRCLVTSAVRNDMRVITVVLNASDWFEDSKALLNQAFNTYQWTPIMAGEMPLADIVVLEGKQDTVAICATGEVAYPLTEDERQRITTEVEYIQQLTAPVVPGQKLGEIRVILDEKLIGSVDVVTKGSVAANQYIDNLKWVIERWFAWPSWGE